MADGFSRDERERLDEMIDAEIKRMYEAETDFRSLSEIRETRFVSLTQDEIAGMTACILADPNERVPVEDDAGAHFIGKAERIRRLSSLKRFVPWSERCLIFD